MQIAACRQQVDRYTAPSNHLQIMLSWRDRSVIYLNNTACSMLEKGCHQQAHETLHDALVVLKSVCSEQVAKVESDTVLRKIDFKLRRAEQRQLHPVRSSIDLPLTSYTNDAEFPCFRSILQQPEDSMRNIYHPIHIELHESGGLAERMHSDVLSSIVMYNFAIASLCAAKLCDKNQALLMQGVVNILVLVTSLLLHCQNQNQALFIGIASYDAMVNILAETGNDWEAGYYSFRLAELRRTAMDWKRLEEVGLPEAAGAA